MPALALTGNNRLAKLQIISDATKFLILFSNFQPIMPPGERTQKAQSAQSAQKAQRTQSAQSAQSAQRTLKAQKSQKSQSAPRKNSRGGSEKPPRGYPGKKARGPAGGERPRRRRLYHFFTITLRTVPSVSFTMLRPGASAPLLTPEASKMASTSAALCSIEPMPTADFLTAEYT